MVDAPDDLPTRCAPVNGHSLHLPAPKFDEPFHWTRAVTALAHLLVERVNELSYINLEHVLFTISPSDSSALWGKQAKLTPLYFPGGQSVGEVNGVTYRAQEIWVKEFRQKYLVTFFMPRFLQQTFSEKLVTIIHELFHISPAFDGDLRRFETSDDHHAGDEKAYDQQMIDIARRFLSSKPDPRYLDFLRLDYVAMKSRYGGVGGVHLAPPKLIPV